ncbi:hypothetical protein PHET_10894 [Paragonimus heterotremus]|uniref:Uncharacterized protein n=1 Tax=Paragonimus heterotremus TaxID=100268 RepID=A0A8J4WE39_9TREM|nr:hypothetical protein PHET_10894 [Paragonimus heterotremus]
MRDATQARRTRTPFFVTARLHLITASPIRLQTHTHLLTEGNSYLPSTAVRV